MTGDSETDGGSSGQCATEETYRRRVDFRDRDPHEAVIDVVAAVTGSEPTDLDPLYSVLDPEALDDLVSAGSGAAGGLLVEFTYHEHCVRVYGSGLIEVELASQSDGDGIDDR